MAKNKDKKEDSSVEIITTEQDKKDEQQKSGKTQKNSEYDIAQYVAFLSAMKFLKKPLEAIPTFTPKNFYEQIQFIDDGTDQSICVYINGTWLSVAVA